MDLLERVVRVWMEEGDAKRKPTRRMRGLMFAGGLCLRRISEQELAGRDQADTAAVTLRQKAQQRQQAVWAIDRYMLMRKYPQVRGRVKLER
jgi:hypothetical protein